MSPDMGDAINSVAQACATAREMLEPVEEAAQGYKKWLTERGWAMDTAEQMALEYYRKVLKYL